MKLAFSALAAACLLPFAPAYVHAAPPTAAVKPAPADVPGSPEEAKKLAQDAPTAAQFPNAAKATILDLADIIVDKNGATKNVTP
ncbi:MAG: hypothetical protein H7Y38_02475, partial [Armatimonadetes bacterium]|nr:hypothetical protein [Armatimonadota bacterium]